MNYKYDKDFLEKLLKTASPSGFERMAAEIWRNKAINTGAEAVYQDMLSG